MGLVYLLKILKKCFKLLSNLKVILLFLANLATYWVFKYLLCYLHMCMPTFTMQSYIIPSNLHYTLMVRRFLCFWSILYMMSWPWKFFINSVLFCWVQMPKFHAYERNLYFCGQTCGQLFGSERSYIICYVSFAKY